MLKAAVLDQFSSMASVPCLACTVTAGMCTVEAHSHGTPSGNQHFYMIRATLVGEGPTGVVFSSHDSI